MVIIEKRILKKHKKIGRIGMTTWVHRNNNTYLNFKTTKRLYPMNLVISHLFIMFLNSYSNYFSVFNLNIFLSF